jgi:hypothetical protein
MIEDYGRGVLVVDSARLPIPMEYRMRYLIIVGLLLSPGATAEIYKCVDPASGRMSFTDKACEEQAPGEHVPVDPTNFDSGPKKQSGNRTWTSQDPTRAGSTDAGCRSSSTGYRRNIENAKGAEQAAQGDC